MNLTILTNICLTLRSTSTVSSVILRLPRFGRRPRRHDAGMIFGRFGLPRKKKAYVRLTQDYDALDVANRIGPSVGFFFTTTA